MSKKEVLKKEAEVIEDTPFKRTKKTVPKKMETEEVNVDDVTPSPVEGEVKKVDVIKQEVGKVDPDAPKWFQKIGGGSLYLRIDGKKRIIKPGVNGGPGERFLAKPSDIPVAFRDSVIPSIPGQNVQSGQSTVPPSAVNRPAFNKRPNGTTGLYDIVNKAGKIVSEQPMSEDEANQVINNLER
jgi:hypothetical protein